MASCHGSAGVSGRGRGQEARTQCCVGRWLWLAQEGHPDLTVVCLNVLSLGEALWSPIVRRDFLALAPHPLWL